jgi:dTDP-glucose pyrophosphorylase
MNLIITGANLDSDYGNLVEVQKNNLVQILDSYSEIMTTITIVLPRYFENLPINDFLSQNYSNLKLKFVNKTRGALCTALLALDSSFLTGEIFIAPADSLNSSGYAAEIKNFLASGSHAGTVFFEQNDDSWSYLRIREKAKIIEISEKRRISNFASTGFFMFRGVDVLLTGAEWALKNSLETNGQYFMSGTLQSLLIMNRTVEAFPIVEPTQFKSFRNQKRLIERENE